MKLNRSVGAASLLMLLSSAVLCVFAVISISSANGDYELSERAAQSTARYYAAYGESQRLLAAAGSDILGVLSETSGFSDVRAVGDAVVCRYDIDSARYFEITITPHEGGAQYVYTVRSAAADDESLWDGGELELWDGQ